MSHRTRPLKVPFWILAVGLLAILAAPAFGTWSIVVVNTETGEVGVGSATCLSNFDLKKGAGVIVVGKGAAQAQASVDTSGVNRTTIAMSLLDGMPADQVLYVLKKTDKKLHDHQYGIADLSGDAATFTGKQTMDFTGGITGICGPIHYAIQGNVLTGEPVVMAAQEALHTTEGDLGQKLMAAMHAAKFYGGDGRCSCMAWNPDGCGSPPSKKKKKEKTWKSADVAYMVIARMGDQDGTFNANSGFACGDYYMDLNVTVTKPEDPVDELQDLYDAFRTSWSGHADHILSQKIIHPASVPGDGQATAQLMISLIDIDDRAIPHGFAKISVTHDVTSAGLSSIGKIHDRHDGTYMVPLTPSIGSGTDVFRVTVDDGMGSVTLYPFPALEVEPAPLLGDRFNVSASRGQPLGFSLSGGSPRAGRCYVLWGTASGTKPGFTRNGIHVPLNHDLLTRSLLGWARTPVFAGGFGMLDGQGNAFAVLDARPGQLNPYAGQGLHFVWTTVGPLDFASNPLRIQVIP